MTPLLLVIIITVLLIVFGVQRRAWGLGWIGDGIALVLFIVWVVLVLRLAGVAV